MNTLALFSTISKGKALWRTKTAGGLIISLFVGICFLAIGLAEYYGFRHFFQILDQTPNIKPMIVAYSLYSLFLLLFALIVASTLITGPYLYLNKKEINLLLPLPLKNLTVFNAHFLQQLLMSLWMALLFGLPAIFALRVIEPSNLILLEGIFFLLILVVIAVVLGNIFFFLIFSLTRKWSYRINFLLLAVLVILLLILVVKAVLPHNIFTLLEADNPQGNPQALANLVNLYHFWPSGWLVNLLLNDLKIISSAERGRFLLADLAVIVLIVQGFLAYFFYRPILQRVQEDQQKLRQKSYLLKFKGFNLLIFKQWFSLIRSRKDVSQLLFFFFLLAIYVSFIFRSPNFNAHLDTVWTPRIIAFIMMTLCYFIILIALRFVFPLVSLEKERSWYLMTLPMNRLKNFQASIIAFTLPAVIVIEAIVLITAVAFKLNVWFFLPLAGLTPFVCLTLITLANTWGTLFPLPEKNDPEAMSTSPSGLSLFVLSSAYALLVIFGLFKEAKYAMSQNIIGVYPGLYYWLIIFGSIILTWLIWKVGQKKYQSMKLA